MPTGFDFCHTMILPRANRSLHNRALSPTEWRKTVEEAGLRVQNLEVIAEDMEFKGICSDRRGGRNNIESNISSRIDTSIQGC